ncbi:phosphatase domain-containing protein [Microbacterium sp. 22242]|uniref:phosphatase domain-containing protein n=1 Tax=Microbacterium sp. 22242 TaxID=3453896 RepID=UPI003F8539FC
MSPGRRPDPPAPMPGLLPARSGTTHRFEPRRGPASPRRPAPPTGEPHAFPVSGPLRRRLCRRLRFPYSPWRQGPVRRGSACACRVHGPAARAACARASPRLPELLHRDRTERSMLMLIERPQAVIVDVDGTLVDVSTVRHHVLNHPKDFDAFHAGAEFCPPILSTLSLVAAWSKVADIFIVTARMRTWEESTRRWLDIHLESGYQALHMRADGDYRPDFEVKAEILASIRKTHDVALAIDDNPSVVDLWESEGIPTVIVQGWAEEVPRG